MRPATCSSLWAVAVRRPELVVASGALGWACYLGVLLMLTIAACAFVVGRRDAHASVGGGTAS